MSTLKVTNFQATGETASRAVSGVAAAWVNMTSAAVINGSFNVSSATDNGTGNYTSSITNSMADTDYAYSVTPLLNSLALTGFGWSKATSSFVSQTASTSSAAYDAETCLNIHGDLA